MSDADDIAYMEVLLDLIRKRGSMTANGCARLTHKKHETAKRVLSKMVENGLLYTKPYGKTTYYVLMPNARTMPDPQKWEYLGKAKDNGYSRGMSIPRFCRAAQRLEVIPQPGFVCHPSTRGKNLNREWMRAHHNGEYQIAIEKTGSMKTTDYFADTDIRVQWETKGLNTNVACHGKIFLHDDVRPWTIRTVSTKEGTFKTLSIRVHARYVYHIDSYETAEAEFRQQVFDIVGVLERGGWSFDKTTIERKGDIHRAYNDVNLGKTVGDYHQCDGDELHYDHSHGTPEAEVYGNCDPSDVEIMVKLPTIIRSFGESLVEIQRNMTLMLDIQSKTVQMMSPPINNDPVATATIFQGGNMYGRL